MAHELVSDDKFLSDDLYDYQANMFNLILDGIVQPLIMMTTVHKKLSLLDLAKFKTPAEKGLEDEDFEGITKLFL